MISSQLKKMFWKEQLENISTNSLPVCQNYKSSDNRQQIITQFSDKFYADILSFSNQRRIKKETLFLMGLSLFLSIYVDSENVIFGLEVPVRKKSIQKIDYNNILPMGLYVDQNCDITEFLQSIQKTYQQTYKFSDIALEEILRLANLPENPIQIVISFEQKYLSAKQSIQSSYPLYLKIQYDDENCKLILDYDDGLFTKIFVERILKYLQNILKEIISNNVKYLSDISLIDQDEYRRLLKLGVLNRDFDYPKNQTFIDLFREKARKYADDVAVVFKDKHLTYRQLDELSDNLSIQLQNYNIQKEQIVAICVERGLEMVICLLGIQKTGAAYLPIMPDYPIERIKYMLHDSNVSLLLTHSNLINQSSFLLDDVVKKQEIKVLDINEVFVKHKITKDEFYKPSPDNMMYVRYTSGSTGYPKGVIVTHKSLLHLLWSMQDAINLNKNDVFLAVTAISFDISDIEIYLSLLVGAKIIIASEVEANNGEKILDLFKRHKISAMQGTPSTWQMLTILDWKNNGKVKVLCGGEALNWELAKSLIPFYHFYGPTETTIWSVYKEVTEINNNTTYVPIGRSLGNTQLYVFRNDKLVPEGAIGELFIGGDGVGRYIDTKMTKESFIDSPFNCREKLYKTGDLVRWLDDGTLEFIGRKDRQIKLRGYRIELGEIETILLRHDYISQCAVIVKNFDNDRQLIAFIKFKNSQVTIDSEDVKLFLRETFPDYMIPSAFFVIDELPKTPNGKLDRQKLDNIHAKMLESVRVRIKPSSKIEKDLLIIFKKTLPSDIYEDISTDDSFFMLGGHSLHAMRTILEINKLFNVKLNIGDIFENPSIQLLSKKIQYFRPIRNVSTLKVDEDLGYIPLSSPQQGLWFLSQIEKNTISYNIPFLYEINGFFDVERLRQAFIKLIERHSILRTVFSIKNNMPIQKIVPISEMSFEFDLIESIDNLNEIELYIQEVINSPFNLEKDIPIRVKVLRLSYNKHILLYCIHHIAIDGWSEKILHREISALYNLNFNMLPKLPLQYSGFAVHQHKQSLDIAKLNYWKKLLESANGISRVIIPTDSVSSVSNTYSGAKINFNLDSQLTNQLKAISKENNVTLFITCLTAFVTLLFRYTQEQDIVIGTGTSGRGQHFGIEDLIGFFINILIIRVKVFPTVDFIGLLKQLKQTTIEAYKNEIPFERLVKVLRPERYGNIPFTRVSFIMDDPDYSELQFNGLRVTQKDPRINFSRLDIEVHIQESNNELIGHVVYSTELFNEATIQQLIQHFKKILSIISQNPKTCISNFSLLLESEKFLIEETNKTDNIFYEATIQEYFEEVVKSKPDNIALRFENNFLTYSELNFEANKIANFLLEVESTKKEDIVAIFIERGFDLIIAILGVLKSGAKYVPVDTSYPENRIQNMLKACDCRIVLTQSSLKNILSSMVSSEVKCITIDNLTNNSQSYSEKTPTCINVSTDDACIIFTSGSTGIPKGVVLSHRGIINLAKAEIEYFEFNEKSRRLQFSSTGFDAMIIELWSTLFSGATLYIFERKKLLLSDSLGKILKENKITHVVLSPSFLSMLNFEDVQYLKVLISAGEACNTDIIYKLTKNNVKFVNAYGPTENSICSTWKIYCQSEIQDNPVIVSIGKPIPNTKAFVLDDQFNDMPIGMIGELYVGGVGLMKGYWHNEELTKKSIIEHDRHGLLYKTGDLVKLLPSGELAYVTRKDHQIKIHGCRVETSEIEAELIKNPNVNQAFVTVNNSSLVDKKLIGYVGVKNILKNDKYTEKCLDNWCTTINYLYEHNGCSNTSDEFKGWVNSYTGKPFYITEMQDWLNQTIERISKEEAEYVWDNGCGEGAILFHYLNGRKDIHYYATDISASVLDCSKNKTYLFPIDVSNQVIFEQRDAITFFDEEKRSYDLVILNSVVQYFPNLDYLVMVLNNAVNSVKPGGRVFIGDIRNLDLLENFHLELALHKTVLEDISYFDLQSFSQFGLLQEKELVIKSEFFEKFAILNHRISGVRVELKRSNFDNELVNYRYDVTFYIERNDTFDEPIFHEWSENMDMGTVEEKLNQSANILVFKNIPNKRFAKTKALFRYGRNAKSLQGLKDAYNTIHEESSTMFMPEEFYCLGEKLDYDVIINWSNGDFQCFDVTFSKDNNYYNATPSPADFLSENCQPNFLNCSNDPVQTIMFNDLSRRLREGLEQSLPHFMVPSIIVVMEQLPINLHGKVDHEKLPSPMIYVGNMQKYKSAENETHRNMIKIWSKVLKLSFDQVGINHNFFRDLGGYSILTVQLLVEINQFFNVDIDIQIFYKYPTVFELSKQIDMLISDKTYNIFSFIPVLK